MNKYLKALPITLVIGIILLGTFYLGKSQSKVIIQGRPPCDAQKILGSTEPISMDEIIRNSCQCPEPEIIYEVGCVDEIEVNGTVRVKSPNVEKYNTLTKEYESFEELKDTITDLKVINLTK